jgi:chemotaxis protein methyltransferase CheR
VNALTTNLTSFFREQHHFDIFADHLKSKPAGISWKVWCSAASTGEEPYSIIMAMLEVLGPRANFSLSASDIDSKVLASAKQGVYKLDGLKGIGPDRLARFFLRGNVMIYFDAATQRRVLEKIHKVMKPGALLFVGHAENFSDSRDLFVLKGKTVYERRS